ncbi:TonB-dependent receptor [Altererythrobacter sp. SALINAS58]|uniref:TonB-dependent receptor domain-containing protein n=1 Tax=Alteripontixanthobacter muriae TaxID=2705546 RepID=UPI001575D6DA|nr:TonB-dependent receptor [Alteripontixanthobacter muriae]NTZ42257.1 TonB-dependent receptor [Alteripontixanthobacter muriae]
MSNRFNKAALLAGTVMAGAMMTAPVHAQVVDDNDLTDQEVALQAAPDERIEDNFIVVTGSRIQRSTTATAAPIAVVNDEEFKLSGTVNVENVINTLPQVVPGTTAFSNNPGNGTATLNLRGLGTNRNLVLVNGRRWMFFDTTQVVDLNTIPSFLIDSVDVVTGGASAVYGSDAIAGVTNFRLRNIEGVELGGQYSLTEEGDGARYEVHGAIGTSFDDGRGSATVFAEYYSRDPIFQGQRGFSNFALGGETSGAPLQQFGSSTLPSGVIRYFGDGDTTGTEFDANGAVVFDVPGDFRQRRGDLYNYAPANYLLIPQERYLMGGYADYEFSDGHEFYTEVTFVNNRVATELAATPVTGDFIVDLATVRPFLSAADFAQLQQLEATESTGAGDGQVELFLQRRTVETGSRNSLDERNAFRVLGGARGAINDYLNYDAYYMYARTRNANVQEGNISRSAFQAGLDGTPGATPINIFGPGTLTQPQLDAISILAQNGDISTLEVANAAISGTAGDFGIGTAEAIGFAVGVEYRRVASQFIPDTALSSGDVIGFNAGDATEGSYDVREVFGEINVPIEFGSARIDITGAARYSDYSLEAVGDAFTYAGGIEFAPIPDVTFRAQYQRAIRAPNIGELFAGQAIGFPAATDPCASAAFIAANPGARELCIATGVPAGSVGDSSIQLNTQIPALFGGNPDLQEETSDSFTAGVVLQPRFIPGLIVTADYFDIEVEDAISPIGLGTAFDLCFAQIQDINDPICQAFVGIRNGIGAITTANPPLVSTANIATLGTSGVDLEVSYTTAVPFSLLTDTGEQDLNLSFLGTWTESSFFEPIAGQGDVIECAGRFGTVNCGNPTPEYKWTSRASFIDGPLTTSVRWRHLSSVQDDNDDVDFAEFNGSEEIDSYDLIDLSFAFDVTEQFSIAMGVNNLFDTLPDTPIFNAAGEVINDTNSLLLGDNQEQANTYAGVYDVLGRDFFVSAAFKF